MGNRRMRATSARRRASVGAQRYNGRGFKVGVEEVPTRKQEPGTPGTIVCKECGTTVKHLPTDPTRPIRHAPGGFSADFRKGRAPCANSGSKGYEITNSTLHPMWNVSDDGKPILEETQARTRDLINVKIIAGRYDITITALQRLIDQGHFVPTMAYLDNKATGTLQRLFSSEAVTEYMKSRRVRRRVRNV